MSNIAHPSCPATSLTDRCDSSQKIFVTVEVYDSIEKAKAAWGAAAIEILLLQR